MGHFALIRTGVVRLFRMRGKTAMLRLSKLTDYAVVVLVRLDAGAEVQTSPGIAARTGIPEPTVAKVLKSLSAAALVTSQRGARGGYRLAPPPADIPPPHRLAPPRRPI